MLKLIRKFLNGLVAGAGIGLGIVSIGAVSAATLSLLTGPQPASDLVSIVNTLINSINSTLAPQGTSTVSNAFGIWGGTGTTVSTSEGLVQFRGGGWPSNWITTSTSTYCNVTSADECLAIMDPSGTIRWIPLFTNH